jgi:hypothetical protein
MTAIFSPDPGPQRDEASKNDECDSERRPPSANPATTSTRKTASGMEASASSVIRPGEQKRIERDDSACCKMLTQQCTQFLRNGCSAARGKHVAEVLRKHEAEHRRRREQHVEDRNGGVEAAEHARPRMRLAASIRA